MWLIAFDTSTGDGIPQFKLISLHYIISLMSVSVDKDIFLW